METIKNYLDNIFSSLPKNAEMLKLKAELLENMESRYSDLRQHGKSENEAIGATISEFGDIDELLNEMDIQANDEQSFEKLAPDEINSFIFATKKSMFLIAIGVFGIIFGAAILVGLSIFSASSAILGVVILLVLVAFGVGLFIYAESITTAFVDINHGDFVLSQSTRKLLEKELAISNKTTNPIIAIGVMLCILSAIPTLFFGALGVVLTVIIVAVGVFLFIYSSGFSEGYEVLLKKSKKNAIRHSRANNYQKN